MSNISIKINLGALIHGKADVLDKNGVMQECLVIPLAPNKIFKGKKTYSLDLVAWPYKTKPENSKDTHYIKQSFTKDEINAMSEEEKANLKFFGNLIVWDQQDNNAESKEFSGVMMNPPSSSDDLPF